MTFLQHTSDQELCRRSLEVARRSYDRGNLPFGCLLADVNGRVLLEAENTVLTAHDSIAHCEINLVHNLAGRYTFEFLNACTLYASTEPCPMCSAALFWAGVGRLVFALGKEAYKKVSGDDQPIYQFPVSASELLSRGGRKVMVEGPLLEEEALAFYASLKPR